MFENINQGPQKERLHSLVTDKFGYVANNPNLVREKVSNILLSFNQCFVDGADFHIVTVTDEDLIPFD